jgi:hypothetical protein
LKAIFFLLITIFFFVSCRKEVFITSSDANLHSNIDTLSFDTVFVTRGSITQSFKIFNDNDQKLRLSSVKLAGGNSSPFKINIDGASQNDLKDIELNANDSLYVFVQVNVDPSSGNLPFILKDSIEIDYNGNKKFIHLRAYGQNAVFLKKSRLKGRVTWNSSLPYVIIGGLQVDTNAVLTIKPGTKVYFHADAPLLVDGTLIANASKDQKIIFSGDRLDAGYNDLPASWPGIFFRNTSKNNSLQYVVIKNAYQGIIAQNLSGTPVPKLTLSHSILDNIYDAGILAINTDMNVDNCLISNCGSNVVIFMGGNYRFINCTIASYSNSFINHSTPVLQVADYIEQDGNLFTAPLKALFQNSIFWGEGAVDNEIVVAKKGTGSFSVTFDHVLYKAKNPVGNAVFVSSIQNEDPVFDSIDITSGIFDFHFKKTDASPAINAGIKTSFPLDLDGKLRDAQPDIGAYEK